MVFSFSFIPASSYRLICKFIFQYFTVHSAPEPESLLCGGVMSWWEIALICPCSEDNMPGVREMCACAVNGVRLELRPTTLA